MTDFTVNLAMKVMLAEKKMQGIFFLSKKYDTIRNALGLLQVSGPSELDRERMTRLIKNAQSNFLSKLKKRMKIYRRVTKVKIIIVPRREVNGTLYPTSNCKQKLNDLLNTLLCFLLPWLRFGSALGLNCKNF